MVALVTREAALFVAGAVSGAAAKTIHRLRAVQKGVNKGMGFVEVILVVPYSAAQLFAYETYMKRFGGKDGELSVIARLAAGACAGMALAFVTYPLDVIRLRLTVEPGHRTMTGVEKNAARRELKQPLVTGLLSTTAATLLCYPLDTGYTSNVNEGQSLYDSFGCYSW